MAADDKFTESTDFAAHTYDPNPVAIEQTRGYAGELLEPGSAFARLAAGATLRTPRGSATAVRNRAGAPEPTAEPPAWDVVVIGAGQAGLSVGYYLACQGLRFVILDANARIGDSWRQRWDSLRLFTPARYDGLPGLPFPRTAERFPTKDEMADYLEAYAAHFTLPVQSGVKVDAVTRDGSGYVVSAGAERYRAAHVVVAAASYQEPKIPAWTEALDPAILQMPASAYRRPSQLRPGRVLLVGAGNTGAEIAVELAATHRVWLAGRHPGHIPVRHGSAFANRVFAPILFRLVFHRLLTVDTPFGRKAKPRFLGRGTPLIRLKPEDLDRAGVQRVGRVVGAAAGVPMLEGGQRLEVENVIWCTGYGPGLDWIHLPVFDAEGRPRQYRGVVDGEPGLYFAGLAYQHAVSSAMIYGVARDARRVAETIGERIRAATRC